MILQVLALSEMILKPRQRLWDSLASIPYFCLAKGMWHVLPSVIGDDLCSTLTKLVGYCTAAIAPLSLFITALHLKSSLMLIASGELGYNPIEWEAKVKQREAEEMTLQEMLMALKKSLEGTKKPE